MEKMPKWADATLVPLISLLLAAILSALVILAIGEDPVAALKLMVEGALMRSSGLSLQGWLSLSRFMRGSLTSAVKDKLCLQGWVSRSAAFIFRGRTGALRCLAPVFLQDFLAPHGR